MVTVYGPPTLILSKLYLPSKLVIAPDFVPEGVWIATIFAPEKGWLLSSKTKPLILEDVTCASALIAPNKKNIANNNFL